MYRREIFSIRIVPLGVICVFSFLAGYRETNNMTAQRCLNVIGKIHVSAITSFRRSFQSSRSSTAFGGSYKV